MSLLRWYGLRGLGAGILLAGMLAGCSGDGGGVALPSSRPSVERTTESTTEATRPTRETPTRETTTAEPTKTTAEPEPTKTTAAAEPTKTTAAAEPTKATPPPQEATATQKATPAETTTPAAVPVSADEGLGTAGWLIILVVLLLVALVGVLLVNRSRRRSDWETELAVVARDTQTAVDLRLPPVLTARTTSERALLWPPLRADLLALAGRWSELAAGTSDESRQYPAAQLAGLLPEMVAAVDAENEALTTHRNWQMLRPRIYDLEQLVGAALATFTAPATPGPGPDPYSS